MKTLKEFVVYKFKAAERECEIADREYGKWSMALEDIENEIDPGQKIVTAYWQWRGLQPKESEGGRA
jgi:hypothetical protein